MSALRIDGRWLDRADRFSRRTFAQTPPLRLARNMQTRAYHEAGHVVVLELAGRRVAGATIDRRKAPKDCAGVVWTGAPPNSQRELEPAPPPVQVPIFADQRPLLFLWAAGYFAGLQAELLLAGQDFHFELHGQSTDDQHAAFILSLAFAPMIGSAPTGGCQALARMMLVEHWRQVEAVAELLLARKTVAGDEIRRAITSSEAPAAAAAFASSGDARPPRAPRIDPQSRRVVSTRPAEPQETWSVLQEIARPRHGSRDLLRGCTAADVQRAGLPAQVVVLPCTTHRTIPHTSA